MSPRDMNEQPIDVNHNWSYTANNGFNKGDKVRIIKTGKEYTFVSYEGVFTAKLENSSGEVHLFPLDKFEHVVKSSTPIAEEMRALEADLQQKQKEVDAWMETALQNQRNADYLRDLLHQCGRAIGKEAYTHEDGSSAFNVVLERVPDCVKLLIEQKNALEKAAMILAKDRQKLQAESHESDFAQQAKELIRGGLASDLDRDIFVDLIIKAAKQ